MTPANAEAASGRTDRSRPAGLTPQTTIRVTPPGGDAVVLPGQRGYDVSIGAGAATRAMAALPEMLGSSPSRAFVVRDAGVPNPFADAVVHALEQAGYAVRVATVSPSERVKTLPTWQSLLAMLAETRHERRDPVVAVGGGIVGDLAGFVAASYRRGCPVVQVPTTLLAMVDASVGGKTGVNLSPSAERGAGTTESSTGPSLLKNFIGAFHPPAHVAVDTEALASLPPRVFACGLAECIKHALIADSEFLEAARDPDLLAWTEQSLPAILAGDAAARAELIARSVRIKAAVVSADPFELAPSAAGGRALLNLGHTFAHAIETLPVRGLKIDPSNASDSEGSPSPLAGSEGDGDPAAFPYLLHGEAVGLGLIAAAATAVELGLSGSHLRARVEDLVAGAELPTRAGDLPPTEDLLAAMSHDKKVQSGRLRLILPTGPARSRVVEDPDPKAVAAGWRAIRG